MDGSHPLVSMAMKSLAVKRPTLSVIESFDADFIWELVYDRAVRQNL